MFISFSSKRFGKEVQLRETPEDSQASEGQRMKYFVGTAVGKKDFNRVEKCTGDCTGRCSVDFFFFFFIHVVNVMFVL